MNTIISSQAIKMTAQVKELTSKFYNLSLTHRIPIIGEKRLPKIFCNLHTNTHKTHAHTPVSHASSIPIK